MSTQWNDQLPDRFHDTVATPVEYELLSDDGTHARKIWGFGPDGARCYYQHEFTLTEDRFDSEEFPISVAVFWERVTAWRLNDGLWLKLRKWTDQLDRCPRRYMTDPYEVVGENRLQR